MLQSKASAKLNVVVQLNDGTRRKGITDAFNPKKSTLLIKEIDVGGNVVEIHDVDMHNVHAIFFVRDLAIMRTSRHTNRDAPVSPPAAAKNGKRVRVTFVWGEVMDGVSPDVDKKTPWFFLFPMGPLNRAYNIHQVYISRKAAARIEPV
jgi:hypothetical protein